MGSKALYLQQMMESCKRPAEVLAITSGKGGGKLLTGSSKVIG